MKHIQVEPTDKMRNFVWSPSKLATYVGDLEGSNGCGVRTFLDYFAGPTYDVMNHYFSFGTFVHEVLEEYHGLSEKPPYEIMRKWATDLWIASDYKKSIAKKYGAKVLEKLEHNEPVAFPDLDPEGSLEFEDMVHGYAKVDIVDELFRGTAKRWMFLGYGSPEEEMDYNKKAFGIFEKYYDLPFVKPASLEMFLSIFFDGVQVRGRVDRIDETDAGGYKVIDYKTSKKPKSGKELNRDFQMICYHVAAKEKFGVPNEKIEVALFFLCPQAKVRGTYIPQPPALNSTRITQSDIDKATMVIVDADKKLKSGFFHYVADNGTWQCPYCDHYGKCGR